MATTRRARPGPAASPGPRPAGARADPAPRDLERALGLPVATSIIVGIVIGSGIFRTPDLIASQVGTTGVILLVWILAGLLVLAGALSYAELGAMMPKAGGAYVYMREAYGPLVAFLTGWASFISNNTAALAAVAVFFGELFTDVAGLPRGHVELRAFGVDLWDLDLNVALVASAAVVLLTAANIRGVRVGGGIQLVFTGLKLGALALIVVVGFALADSSAFTLTPLWPARASFDLVTAFGVAMVAALFTYDGWTNANNVAEEIRNPGRNLPRALLLGTVLVIVVYFVANLAYLWVLGPEGLAGTQGRTAAETMTQTLGAGGARFVTVAILLSLFGTLNGQCLAYPRIYFAMARDGLFFRRAAETHPRWRTPHFSLVIQAAVAVAFIFAGGYDFLINLVVFSAFLFYGAAVAAVFVLRRSRPDLARPYRTWGYPWVPALFIVVALALSVNSLVQLRASSLLGLAVILTGVPVYYGWLRWQRRSAND